MKYEMRMWSPSNCLYLWLHVVPLTQWLQLYTYAHKHSSTLILSPQGCCVNSFVGTQLENGLEMQQI